MTLAKLWSRRVAETPHKPIVRGPVFHVTGKALDAVGRIVGVKRTMLEDDDRETSRDANVLVQQTDESYRDDILDFLMAEVRTRWLTIETVKRYAAVCGLMVDVEDDGSVDVDAVTMRIESALVYYRNGHQPQADEDYDERVLLDIHKNDYDEYDPMELYKDDADVVSHEVIEMIEPEDDSSNEPVCRFCRLPYLDCGCEEFSP